MEIELKLQMIRTLLSLYLRNLTLSYLSQPINPKPLPIPRLEFLVHSM
jgi:hypothetical protein